MKKIFGVFVIACTLLLIPSNVNAKADFDKYLTNGKLVINGVKPQDEYEAYDRLGEYFNNLEVFDYQIAPASCDDTFTTCYLVYNLGKEDEEDKEIEIVYNYDESIKKVVDNIIENMGNKTTFKLTDMEIINYFLYRSEDSNLSSFSMEFRKNLGYKNFELDLRGGDEHPFYKDNIGIVKLIYNDTVYSYKDGFGVTAEQVIYIDDNENDIINAIKKRITDTFGNVDIEVSEGDTIASFLDSERENSEGYMNELYYNDDAPYHFLVQNNILEKYYILKINGEEYYFAVIKDSSKVNNNLNYLTIDTSSDVEINTTSILPLDTLIKVSKLTTGKEYDEIVKVLDTKNLDMFDLKLFSKSINNYITKLEDGTFEVKLPLKEEFKGKDLVVYYVNEEGKTEEYTVTIKDNYAIFNTNHFSIYTLTEKKSNTNIPENTDKKDDTTITKEENPKTGDNILLYLTTGIISLVGLSISGIYVYRKKENN